MRVLVLSNNYSGLYNFRKELLSAIAHAGNEIIVSAPFDDKCSYFTEAGYKVINTSFNRKGTNPIADLMLLFRYLRILRIHVPDVVLSYTIKPNLYGGMACRICQTPQIANITGLGVAVENPGPLQRLTTLLYSVALRRTKMVFFQNEANMQFFLRRGMVKGDYRLIPGSGVNLEWHKPQEYPDESIIRFIFIGRVIKEKGIEQYLAAAAYIRMRYPSTEFIVMGGCEGDYLERLRALNNEGVITYIGRQHDVRPFIGASHCTIHPSFYPEGMSNVLLESCAACRPVITTNRPGCREVVEDGVTGFLIKQCDSIDLIDKIERFIALPYSKKKEMGMRARNKVELQFNREIVINAYLEELSKV